MVSSVLPLCNAGAGVTKFPVLPWLSTLMPKVMEVDEFPGPEFVRPSSPESVVLAVPTVVPVATAEDAARFRVGPLLSTGFRFAKSFFCRSISSRSLAMSSCRFANS